MNLLTKNRLDDILIQQRLFFNSHQTKEISYRKKNLKKLLYAVESNENENSRSIKKRFK